MVCKICGLKMRIIAKKKYIYFRCPNCHFYDTKGWENEDFSYEYYEDSDYSDWMKKEKECERILAFKFHLLGYKPKSFLDVGCSEGPFVKAYDQITCNKGTGVEVSEEKVSRGRGKGIDLYTYKSLPNRKYQFILSRHVIEHIENPNAHLEFMLSHLDRGG